MGRKSIKSPCSIKTESAQRAVKQTQSGGKKDCTAARLFTRSTICNRNLGSLCSPAQTTTGSEGCKRLYHPVSNVSPDNDSIAANCRNDHSPQCSNNCPKGCPRCNYQS